MLTSDMRRSDPDLWTATPFGTDSELYRCDRISQEVASEFIANAVSDVTHCEEIRQAANELISTRGESIASFLNACLSGESGWEEDEEWSFSLDYNESEMPAYLSELPEFRGVVASEVPELPDDVDEALITALQTTLESTQSPETNIAGWAITSTSDGLLTSTMEQIEMLVPRQYIFRWLNINHGMIGEALRWAYATDIRMWVRDCHAALVGAIQAKIYHAGQPTSSTDDAEYLFPAYCYGEVPEAFTESGQAMAAGEMMMYYPLSSNPTTVSPSPPLYASAHITYLSYDVLKGVATDFAPTLWDMIQGARAASLPARKEGIPAKLERVWKGIIWPKFGDDYGYLALALNPLYYIQTASWRAAYEWFKSLFRSTYHRDRFHSFGLGAFTTPDHLAGGKPLSPSEAADLEVADPANHRNWRRAAERVHGGDNGWDALDKEHGPQQYQFGDTGYRHALRRDDETGRAWYVKLKGIDMQPSSWFIHAMGSVPIVETPPDTPSGSTAATQAGRLSPVTGAVSGYGMSQRAIPQLHGYPPSFRRARVQLFTENYKPHAFKDGRSLPRVVPVTYRYSRELGEGMQGVNFRLFVDGKRDMDWDMTQNIIFKQSADSVKLEGLMVWAASYYIPTILDSGDIATERS